MGKFGEVRVRVDQGVDLSAMEHDPTWAVWTKFDVWRMHHTSNRDFLATDAVEEPRFIAHGQGAPDKLCDFVCRRASGVDDGVDKAFLDVVEGQLVQLRGR